MERLTISLDAKLAGEFDAWMAKRGYSNRSEAVRDMVREKLAAELLDAGRARWCVATLAYVYDRSEPSVVARVIQWQHDHHDLVASSQCALLDHQDCLETVIARGETSSLEACAAQLIAIRGVRHGTIQLVPLRESRAHAHADAAGHRPHRHLRPVS